jgi:hypothetical protein
MVPKNKDNDDFYRASYEIDGHLQNSRALEEFHFPTAHQRTSGPIFSPFNPMPLTPLTLLIETLHDGSTKLLVSNEIVFGSSPSIVSKSYFMIKWHSATFNSCAAKNRPGHA